MACDITAGRLVPCKNTIGGVRKVFFFNYVENAFTVTNSVATAINPLVTDVFEYELVGDTHNLLQSMVSSSTAGTTVNTQTLTMALNSMSKEDSHQLNLLAYGRPIAVVQDKNGNYLACGLLEGIDFTVAPTTGAGKADFNGYTLTGVSMEGALAPHLDSATITALLALV
jgi:hypothetical protein